MDPGDQKIRIQISAFNPCWNPKWLKKRRQYTCRIGQIQRKSNHRSRIQKIVQRFKLRILHRDLSFDTTQPQRSLWWSHYLWSQRAENQRENRSQKGCAAARLQLCHFVKKNKRTFVIDVNIIRGPKMYFCAIFTNDNYYSRSWKTCCCYAGSHLYQFCDRISFFFCSHCIFFPKLLKITLSTFSTFLHL